MDTDVAAVFIGAEELGAVGVGIAQQAACFFDDIDQGRFFAFQYIYTRVAHLSVEFDHASHGEFGGHANHHFVVGLQG